MATALSGVAAQVEKETWSTLMGYVDALRQLNVFHAATRGYIGQYGLMVPLSVAPDEYIEAADSIPSRDVYLFSWDQQSEQCQITALDQSESDPVTEVRQRYYLLQRTLRLIRRIAAQFWEENPNAELLPLESREPLNWRAEYDCDCQHPWEEHIQPGYICPLPLSA